MRQCDGCNKPFVADEGWKRKCLICWKTESKYELAKGDKAFAEMQDAYVEIEKKHSENAKELTASLDEARGKLEKMIQGYRTVRKTLQDERAQWDEERTRLSTLRAAPPTTAPELSQERIRDLIKLVHPDKHGGTLNEKATEITKWLLGLRKK